MNLAFLDEQARNNADRTIFGRRKKKRMVFWFLCTRIFISQTVPVWLDSMRSDLRLWQQTGLSEVVHGFSDVKTVYLPFPRQMCSYIVPTGPENILLMFLLLTSDPSSSDRSSEKQTYLTDLDMADLNNPRLNMVSYSDLKYWCTVFYYELNTRVGDAFHAGRLTLTIDGFTEPCYRADRFSLGSLSHVDRPPQVEMTRRHIGKSIVTNLSSDYFNCGIRESLLEL